MACVSYNAMCLISGQIYKLGERRKRSQKKELIIVNRTIGIVFSTLL